MANILNRIKSWFYKSETNELRYDTEHKDFSDSHHYTDTPKPRMQDRIHPEE